MDNKKIKDLEEKIKILESELEASRNREEEQEFLIQQYNSLVKEEFNTFDDFVQALVTRKIIDENTRVYSKDFFEKLFSLYYQKAFELNKECGIIIIKIPYMSKIKGDEKHIAERQVGKILRESVRIPLDIIARYSETTFIILLTDIVHDVFQIIRGRITDRLGNLTDYCANMEIKNFYIPDEKVSSEIIYKELEI